MSFVVFTDGCSNLPGSVLNRYRIRTLPFTYTINDKQIVYNGDIDTFDAHAHYELLRSGEMIKTNKSTIVVSPAGVDISGFAPDVDEQPAEEVVEEVVEERVYGEPDPVEPIKEQVTIDDFAKMDFRVCKILKAEGVRKSHSCLKLTLFDGIGERVIMSSIKAEYTPEQLVGKKIIVIANLKPTRLTGVTSEGMLLAATNHSCGCQLIFVDDSVPTGTVIK